jgi:DtxR family Mn-dependent transcriptional regulator
MLVFARAIGRQGENVAEAEPTQTSTVEDYLQTIYSLETEGERVITSRLAKWRRVKQPTAWTSIRRMEANGLVRIDDDKSIHLTVAGRRAAERVARRHRLSERFLNEVLGLSWADAHEQAHLFEHGVTPMIEDRIFEILGRPSTCPHGSPIPGTGAALDPDWVLLDSLETGDEATLRFISEELEEDRALLAYLDRHGLRPGCEFAVAEKLPTMISLRTSDEVVSLDRFAATRMRVSPAVRTQDARSLSA